MQKVVVFTGAGISLESGLKTFRDQGGLWEGYRVEDVCTPMALRDHPERVLNFYNDRRREAKAAQPNQAHIALAELESKFEVTIVTQNIDDLHERGGSSNVIHLHGEIFKARSYNDPDDIQDWHEDITMEDNLRPHVVFFHEGVLRLDEAMELSRQADIMIVCGTTLNVSPANRIVEKTKAPLIYLVDPNPPRTYSTRIQTLKEVATIGVPKVVGELLST